MLHWPRTQPLQSPHPDVRYLAIGFAYLIVYVLFGKALACFPTALSIYGAAALLLPALSVPVIVLRRRDKGGPLLTEVLSGVALAAGGAVCLTMLGLRRLSLLAATRGMACCLGIAVPWSPRMRAACPTRSGRD